MLRTLEKMFRNYFPKHLKSKDIYLNALEDKVGIEIGGPSFSFSKMGLLPIYKVIAALDGCNFSNNTVWEGALTAGQNYLFDKNKQAGKQFISEGNDLQQIPDNIYDFVLSCHNLEHFANPIKALAEWKRITKPSGYLLLVLPNKEKTFDHNRPVTSIEHLWKDFDVKMTEDDSTHFQEVIELHDIEMDSGIENKEALITRTLNNIENRCVHHHVFNEGLVKNMLEKIGYEVIQMDAIQINIFALARNKK